MNKKVCVITACTGNYKATIRSIDHLDVDGYVFGDARDEDIDIQGNRWKRDKTQYFYHTDTFTMAKYYKCFWSQIPALREYDVVVWIDGTIEIKQLPIEYLEDHDLVVYEHGGRFNTIQENNNTVIRLDPRYYDFCDGLERQREEPNIDWLAITCFVVHKKCEKIIHMQNEWFSEIIRYSPQDQVSFPRACDRADVRVKLLPVAHRKESHQETAHYKKHKHLIPYKNYK